MDLKQLEYIVKIAEYENLTAAAQALFISQSTLSLYLSNLEKKLNILLFQREKNRLHITPAGRLYVNTARQILELKNQLYNELQDYRKEKSLKVGLASIYAFQVFSQVLLENQEEFSQLTINITEGRALPMLRQLEQETLDFAIVGRNYFIKEPKFISKLIRQELMVICIYKDHPYSHLAVPVGQIPPRVDASIFSNDPFVIPPKETSDGILALDILKKYCTNYNVLCYINDTASIINMVRHEFGITILPCSVFYSVESLKELYWCRPQKDFYRNIQLVYNKKREMNSIESSLFSKLQEKYDNEHLERFDEDL